VCSGVGGGSGQQERVRSIWPGMHRIRRKAGEKWPKQPCSAQTSQRFNKGKIRDGDATLCGRSQVHMFQEPWGRMGDGVGPPLGEEIRGGFVTGRVPRVSSIY